MSHKFVIYYIFEVRINLLTQQFNYMWYHFPATAALTSHGGPSNSSTNQQQHSTNSSSSTTASAAAAVNTSTHSTTGVAGAHHKDSSPNAKHGNGHGPVVGLNTGSAAGINGSNLVVTQRPAGAMAPGTPSAKTKVTIIILLLY